MENKELKEFLNQFPENFKITVNGADFTVEGNFSMDGSMLGGVINLVAAGAIPKKKNMIEPDANDSRQSGNSGGTIRDKKKTVAKFKNLHGAMFNDIASGISKSDFIKKYGACGNTFYRYKKKAAVVGGENETPETAVSENAGKKDKSVFKKKYTLCSPEEREKIKDEIKNGASFKEINKKYGISFNTFNRRKRESENSVKIPERGEISEKIKESVIADVKLHLTTPQILKKYRINLKTLSDIKKKAESTDEPGVIDPPESLMVGDIEGDDETVRRIILEEHLRFFGPEIMAAIKSGASKEYCFDKWLVPYYIYDVCKQRIAEQKNAASDTEGIKDVLLKLRKRILSDSIDDILKNGVNDETECPADKKTGTIREIDRALEKLDDGTYGKCDGCGMPIKPESLQIIPYSMLCSRCLNEKVENTTKGEIKINEPKKIFTEEERKNIAKEALLIQDRTESDMQRIADKYGAKYKNVYKWAKQYASELGIPYKKNNGFKKRIAEQKEYKEKIVSAIKAGKTREEIESETGPIFWRSWYRYVRDAKIAKGESVSVSNRRYVQENREKIMSDIKAGLPDNEIMEKYRIARETLRRHKIRVYGKNYGAAEPAASGVPECFGKGYIEKVEKAMQDHVAEKQKNLENLLKEEIKAGLGYEEIFNKYKDSIFLTEAAFERLSVEAVPGKNYKKRGRNAEERRERRENMFADIKAGMPIDKFRNKYGVSKLTFSRYEGMVALEQSASSEGLGGKPESAGEHMRFVSNHKDKIIEELVKGMSKKECLAKYKISLRLYEDLSSIADARRCKEDEKSLPPIVISKSRLERSRSIIEELNLAEDRVFRETGSYDFTQAKNSSNQASLDR